MLKHLLLFLSLCFLCPTLFGQRDTLSLNSDWQFLADKKSVGFTEQWYSRPLSTNRIVTLPHTWNVEEENQNHYGWGWYQKKINVPADWKNKNIVLQFGAINHTASIYVNGQFVGSHIGDGFNKFYIPLHNRVKMAM